MRGISISDRIVKHIHGKGRGWVFTPRDFIDLGSRGAVDVSLARLKQSGKIRRIGHGLYDYPVLHEKLGPLSPKLDSLAQAVSNQSRTKVFDSGATAVKNLGLSTQVPARPTFTTSGPSRVKKVAGRTLALKHARIPLIENAPDHVNAVLQAMVHLGRKNVDADTIQRFADRLDDRYLKALMKSRTKIPGWMGDIVLKISAAKHG
ncbi:DUF6088 family protein [Advenella mimigardefordensis]|uniref:Transcriptional regulator, AbiEi antitoxin, Type IV TA system n=1 Tax=Advenella mimigardefordensis (strain DSM 17166 / LMG 22922 / DPN7) TaxID=1247726 RepID=W0PD80_ADVMD|nr:DUF6088 family protein [Advenella mimigardefordensis]AHG64691.1 hypothetical protein MIM_c26210 [Advenella mimigardefordensis DPN7]